MLPRRQKLSRRSFPTQHDQKTTWRGDVLLVRFTKTKETSPPRFAVVVSKKNFRSAVDRNYIRRVVYRAIRDSLDDFATFIGAKFIITIQKQSSTPLKKELIYLDIKKFLSR